MPGRGSYCDGPRCARTSLRCLARGSRRKTRCARWGELRSNSCGEPVHDARYARRPPGQAPQPTQKSPPPGTACHDSQPGRCSDVECQHCHFSKGAGGRAVARNQARRLRWPVLCPARLRASSSCSSHLSERSSPQASAASCATRAQDGTAQVQSAPMGADRLVARHSPRARDFGAEGPTALSRDTDRPPATLPHGPGRRARPAGAADANRWRSGKPSRCAAPWLRHTSGMRSAARSAVRRRPRRWAAPARKDPGSCRTA